jgi:hypothetical protein
MQRFKRTTSEINKHVRGLSDEELLRCVNDDSVMVPFSLMSVEDVEDILNKKNGSLITKKKAIEKELNRRGLKWRQYSDEERDCLWSLQDLLFSGAPVTPEAVKEFWRLVNANGGKVLCHRFSPSERNIEALKLRLEAIGLLAEWTLDDRGNVWVDVKETRL